MYVENRFSYNWLIKKIVNDKVRKNLGVLHGVVLDLGCGARPYEADILRHADCYIGIDWSNTLHGLRAEVIADLNRPLPLKDRSVDCVVSFEVLEHLAEPSVMLTQSYRVLRDNGVMMLSTPFQRWVHEAPWDYYRYTCHGLAYLLRKAGFREISIEPTSGFWSMWVLKLNYQLVRLVRGPRAIRWIIRGVLVPLWWIGQTLAPLLDDYWPEDRETAGYFVIARKL